MKTLDPRPGRPSEIFPGIYRGVVEAVDDPEQRKRYRVRVVNVHPPAVETAHLPWAELSGGFGGSTFGDIPAYELDDEVWVMFEGGHARFPVIIGGILNFAGGVPPTPPEQAGDTEAATRWVRVDRVGNKIEMSPIDEELWVRIVTPDGSFVQVSAADGSVQISGEGRVILAAPNVQINATEELNVATAKLVADVTDECTIRGSDVVNVRGASEVNIGEYLPPDTTGTGSIPETSAVVNIKAADTVKIESAGTLDVDVAGDMTCDVVGNATVAGQADVVVSVGGDALLDVEGNVTADIEGTLTVDAAQKVTVNGQAEIEVTAGSTFLVTAGSTFDVQATAALTIDGAATVDVRAGATMTIDASANLDINCGGALALAADSILTLAAPTVRITAQSILDMDGGSTARLDAAAILIG